MAKARSSPNYFNEKNKRLLHLASRAGWTDTMLRCLDEFGSDINTPDDEGRTPLHCAIEGDAMRSIHFLLRYGRKSGETLDVNTQAYDQKLTPLAIATTQNNALAVKALISYQGINPNITCKAQETALYKAITIGAWECAQLICTHPDTDASIADIYKITPLHVAAFRGDLEMVTLLISHPTANVYAQDHEGRTALETLLSSTEIDHDTQADILKIFRQYHKKA